MVRASFGPGLFQNVTFLTSKRQGSGWAVFLLNLSNSFLSCLLQQLNSKERKRLFLGWQSLFCWTRLFRFWNVCFNNLKKGPCSFSKRPFDIYKINTSRFNKRTEKTVMAITALGVTNHRCWFHSPTSRAVGRRTEEGHVCSTTHTYNKTDEVRRGWMLS